MPLSICHTRPASATLSGRFSASVAEVQGLCELESKLLVEKFAFTF